MDIGLIIHELRVEGGGERLCVCLAEALLQRGHDVVIYTSAYDRSACFPEVCKTLRIKEIGRGVFPWIRRPLFIRGYLDMLRMAKRVDKGHDIWNPHHWPAQWGAAWLKRRLGGHVAWNCNDVPDFIQKARDRQSLKELFLAPLYWLYYLYDRRQNCAIDRTLLLSYWAESEYRALYAGETTVVRCGMDPALFTPGGQRTHIRSRFHYSDEDFVLLWLGIFMPHRRLEDAIEALSRLSARNIKVQLLLAGSNRKYPEYVKSLIKLTHTLGVQDQVIFADKVADEEIRDFYCACDAFIFPNDRQTWGLTVLEAMSCGRPVLVSRGAGVHEVLRDGETALIFSPRAPAELAEKVETLIDNPRLREEIAQNGMNCAHKYSWDFFAAQVDDICRELIDQDKSSFLCAV